MLFILLILIILFVIFKQDETNRNLPPKGVVGNQTDSHGCFLTAGYQWCQSKNKCIRIWEEEC